jgi:hypothetical protein
MDTKLTLRLDNSIIEKAKNYAKNKNTSLSKLIESYLGKLVTPNDTHEVTPLVKSLSGVIDLPKNFDTKKEYKKHLSNKYTK